MAKVLTKLSDVLGTIKLHSLLQRIDTAGIDVSDIVSEKDWKGLSDATQGFNENRIDLFIEEYHDYLEHDELDEMNEFYSSGFLIKDFEAFAAEHADRPEYVEEKRSLQESRLYGIHLYGVTGLLLSRKDELAKRLAEYLLQPEVMEAYLMEAGDGVIQILMKMIQKNPELSSRRRKYALHLAFSENSSADSLMQMGYGLVQDSPFWKNKDLHRHVIGMTVTSDVLECFKRIHTPEFEQRRSTKLRVMECCQLGALYYGTVPTETVYEIYKRICPAYKLEPVGLKEFVEIAETETSDRFEVVEYKGKKYITEINNVMNDYPMETVSDDGAKEIVYVPYYERTVEAILEINPEFYLPDEEEAMEFIRFGWWPSREPYQRLKEWVTMFYMDERDIENEYSSMLQALYPDQGYHDKYGMDYVEQSTNDQLRSIAEDFMLDVTPDDIIQFWDEIQEKIREDALENLRGILEDCQEQTNSWNFWGLMPKDIDPEIWKRWKRG